MAIALSACTKTPSLMPTPTFYLEESFDEDRIPQQLRVPEAKIFYITDRAIEPSALSKRKEGEQASLNYGSKRSPSLGYGNATVKFKNKNIDWDTAVPLTYHTKIN